MNKEEFIKLYVIQNANTNPLSAIDAAVKAWSALVNEGFANKHESIRK